VNGLPFINVSPANIDTGVEATLAAARPWRAKRKDVLGAMKMKGGYRLD